MQGPKVSSIEGLREFRVDLKRFQEEASAALEQASSEVERALDWVRLDRMPYWKHEIQRRKEELTRAKQKLNSARLTSFDQAGKSYVDEKKGIEKAKARLAEAEDRLRATQRWGRRLEKEHELFRGRIGSLATFLSGELPRATDRLAKMAGELEKYVSMTVPAEAEKPLAGGSSGGVGGGGGGGRGGGERVTWGARTPGREVRKRLVIGALDDEMPEAALIDRAALKEFAKADLRGELPVMLDKAVVEVGWLACERLLMHRYARPALGDSGWYLGDAMREASPGEGELRATRCEEVARLCPELTDLLAMPYGWSVVIAGGEIEAVFDEHSRPAWKPEA